MSRTAKKRSSIYFRLGRLLVLAAVAAAACFLLLNAGGNMLAEYYLMNSDYTAQRDARYAGELQDYVAENRLAVHDTAQLGDWVRKQSVIAIRVYQSGTLVYDSMYPEATEWEDAADADYYDWAQYYTVTFADGNADVHLYGFYEYQFHNYALMASLLCAFLLFLTIVMLGIRKTMQYIRQLGREIGILEGGNLEYEITVSGNDELTDLAKGLNAMRVAIRAQAEKEWQITQSNQRMVTEMSHDLRTPLTSIMLYTELLRQHKYDSQEKMEEYIDRIDKKAHQMKQRSDHLFEYALITSNTNVDLEGPLLFQETFYDMLSETTSYLEQNGFQVALDLTWETYCVCISADYISRIFDNLTSNLLKYADPGTRIVIQTVYRSDFVGLSFANAKLKHDRKEESTRIGLQNIKNMMQKMHGSCEVTEADHTFKITLLFPKDHSGSVSSIN